MGTITINGKTYVGNSVSVINNRVIIDGKDQTPDAKEINIAVEGNLENLSVDYAQTIKVTGHVGKLQTTSGDVYCNDVDGNLTTVSGDVQCGDVKGDVQTTSGDVSAETIGGSVKTISGDIKHRK